MSQPRAEPALPATPGTPDVAATAFSLGLTVNVSLWVTGGEVVKRWWRGGGEVAERWWRGGGEVVVVRTRSSALGSLSCHSQACTKLRWQNTWESDSRRPRHLGLNIGMDGGRKNVAKCGKNTLQLHTQPTLYRSTRERVSTVEPSCVPEAK